MTMRSPDLLDTAIVSDDAHLAARLCSVLAKRGHYLAVLDGPRLTRSDAEHEIVRRNNALARINPNRVIISGLSKLQDGAMASHLPGALICRCEASEVKTLASASMLNKTRISWGQKNIGAGLLRALYAGRMIEFGDDGPTDSSTSRSSNHLVVCESGSPLSEVIAANYAYALGAGLSIIPEVEKQIAEQILEGFYQSEHAEQRSQLRAQLRELCGNIPTPDGTSLSFFTKNLPFGVGFPERPSTHLFTYPDCGISVINGFAAEQRGSRGVNVAVLIDPEKTTAPEIDAANNTLPKRSVFVREFRGEVASVRTITDIVDYFPYDLLLFATHCGDAPGSRWTYEYEDSEGIDRRLVVDVAIGVGSTDDPDLLEVIEFNYFHSLDGVDWNDPIAKADLYVGTAINDYVDWSRNEGLEPVSKEPLDRIRSSAAMAMSDNNYIRLPTSLADNGTPIIINNACVSWHELAKRFTFGNARAYIGTLYPVLPFEAEGVSVKLLDKYWGRPLPHALWSAQIGIYGKNDHRRPYVMTGVYTQKLRATKENVPLHIMRRLSDSAFERAQLAEQAQNEQRRQSQHVADFYRREADAFHKKWFRGDL